MKMYGTEICIDCRNAIAELKARGIEYEYIDITSTSKLLAEFIRMRDTSEAFGRVREKGTIGIPCFMIEKDGKTEVTFKLEKALALLQEA